MSKLLIVLLLGSISTRVEALSLTRIRVLCFSQLIGASASLGMSSFLTWNIQQANQQVLDTVPSTPKEHQEKIYRAKEFDQKLNAAYIATSMAALEVLLSGGMLWEIPRFQALCFPYWIPLVLNAIMIPLSSEQGGSTIVPWFFVRLISSLVPLTTFFTFREPR